MYRSSLFLTAALIGTSIALIQPVAAAKSASEVEAIARAVTVEIKFKFRDNDGKILEEVGSGTIIDRKGDLYTLVTNKHVVCGGQPCSELPPVESYNLGLADGQQYRAKALNIKLLGDDLDLAIIQFRSNRNYAVAKVAAPGSLKIEHDVYTAGFPIEQPGFTFQKGNVIAVVNKRLTVDQGGYTIIYDAPTLPGMSGGGVFDANGQLVAIHGYGYTFGKSTDLDDKSRVGKTGYNKGIPIRWLVQNLAELGINLGTDRSISGIRAARSQVPATADEYFIAGVNKFVNPDNNNVVAEKQQAILEFSKAIRLNPRYLHAYFMRAIVYQQGREFQKSLADYNQAIIINPKYSNAYYNRAILKYDKLNDIQGALADYNQAILLDPEYSEAYNNRALLKDKKLNDIKGALADYDKAIIINPKSSQVYFNRAILKFTKLDDTQGMLDDLNQAIIINPNYSEAYYVRARLKADILNDIQGALDDLNQAILLNPKDSGAYYNRANPKADKLNDIQGALDDLNQAILPNRNYSEAYYNRAILKYYKLNDIQGALDDLNQAILLNPEYSEAYYNRAILKDVNLNDIEGALDDYNQAILSNPKYAEAYNLRGLLKVYRLNDQAGAIQDFRQAARFSREQGDTQGLQLAIGFLQMLGATE
jgi:tetratricopeptide (TPR) repeat protein